MYPHSSTNPSLLFLTVQLSLPPTLYLEGLPRKYVAAQLHLHWGQKGSPGGSEHQINGQASAAEVPGGEAWTRTLTGTGAAGERKELETGQSCTWGITPTCVGQI